MGLWPTITSVLRTVHTGSLGRVRGREPTQSLPSGGSEVCAGTPGSRAQPFLRPLSCSGSGLGRPLRTQREGLGPAGTPSQAWRFLGPLPQAPQVLAPSLRPVETINEWVKAGRGAGLHGVATGPLRLFPLLAAPWAGWCLPWFPPISDSPGSSPLWTLSIWG